MTLITQSLEAFTDPSVGAIERTVSLVVVVIQVGRAVPSAITMDVKAPVVAHEFAEQARIAGLDVYAPEFTAGRGSVTVVVEPTAALDVVPVPSSQACKAHAQEGVATVTVKLTVMEV